MAREHEIGDIVAESGADNLPELRSKIAKRKMDESIEEANLQEDSLTIEVLEDVLSRIAGKVAENVSNGTDMAGAITSKKPDALDASNEGVPLWRSPREKAQNAIPRLREAVFRPLIYIQQARDAVEEAKPFVGNTGAEKVALKDLHKAMNQAFGPAEAKAYQAIATAMRQLVSDYKAFIKQYEGQITGDTRLALDDAITIARHAERIAAIQYQARMANRSIP